MLVIKSNSDEKNFIWLHLKNKSLHFKKRHKKKSDFTKNQKLANEKMNKYIYIFFLKVFILANTQSTQNDCTISIWDKRLPYSMDYSSKNSHLLLTLNKYINK